MRFYNQNHEYYCGIDLHTKMMYLCIYNNQGDKVLHQNIAVDTELFLKTIMPYLPDVVVCVECIFTWYWIADLCYQHNIPFVLGHALYMKAIHGSKTKNDRIDSKKIALLLKSGMIPVSYVYPANMRSTRDLLRRRMRFMYKRAELLTHIQNTKSQYNLPDFENSIARKRFRKDVHKHFDDPSVQQSILVDLELIEHYENILCKIEWYITKHAIEHQPKNIIRLKSIPGVGKILALVILYEIHDINRFERVQNFCSYARLVCPQKESAGKTTAKGNKKMGSAYLKWAFGEATLLLIRESVFVKELHKKLKNKYGKARALSIISHKLGRAVYYMLKNGELFDLKKFVQ